MKKTKSCCATKWGLIAGSFLALVHAVWSLFVAATPVGVQQFVNWILSLHSIAMPIAIKPFEIQNAVLLVIVTFAIGFVFGWVFEKITDLVSNKC